MRRQLGGAAMTLTALLEDVECQLVALEIADALRTADREREELAALQRWRQHEDRTQVSAEDWAVFARHWYSASWLRQPKAVCA